MISREHNFRGRLIQQNSVNGILCTENSLNFLVKKPEESL